MNLYKFNKEYIKDIIDEIIYESVIGKNPFKEGDLVKLRPDVLGRHSKSVPAHAGYSKNEFSWRETLSKLVDKTGKITRIFPDSKHVNVEFPQAWTSKDAYGREYTVNTIGIDYTELLPAEKSISENTNHNPHVIQQMRNWVKDCQWRDVSDESDIDDMSDEEILRGIQKHYEGGVNQFLRDMEPKSAIEGFGYVSDKDIKKDPKHIPGERWRIKFNENMIKEELNNESFGKTTRNTLLSVLAALSMAAATPDGWRHTGATNSTSEMYMRGDFIIAHKSQHVFVLINRADGKYVRVGEFKTLQQAKDAANKTEKSVNVNEVKSVIKELIKEMWVGFEEKTDESASRDRNLPLQYTMPKPQPGENPLEYLKKHFKSHPALQNFLKKQQALKKK